MIATLDRRTLGPFHSTTLGQLAAIGRRTGVANLSKPPRVEKKLRVVLDWTLDLVFAKPFAPSAGEDRAPARAPLSRLGSATG